MDITTFNTIFERIKKDSNAVEFESALKALLSECRDAGNAAREAERAYFYDVREKEAAAAALANELNNQLPAIQAEVDTLRDSLIKAAANEGAGELERIRASMWELEEKETQIKKEIRLLSRPTVRGDDDLYEDVKAKDRYYIELRKATLEGLQTVENSDVLSLYCSIIELCSNSRKYVGDGVYMRRIDDHYKTGRKVDEARESGGRPPVSIEYRSADLTEREIEEIKQRQLPDLPELVHVFRDSRKAEKLNNYKERRKRELAEAKRNRT